LVVAGDHPLQPGVCRVHREDRHRRASTGCRAGHVAGKRFPREVLGDRAALDAAKVRAERAHAACRQCKQDGFGRSLSQDLARRRAAASFTSVAGCALAIEEDLAVGRG
jgi:hypothetical protein